MSQYGFTRPQWDKTHDCHSTIEHSHSAPNHKKTQQWMKADFQYYLHSMLFSVQFSNDLLHPLFPKNIVIE